VLGIRRQTREVGARFRSSRHGPIEGIDHD